MESSRDCQLLNTYHIMLLTVTLVNMFFAHGVLSSASTCSSPPGPLGMEDGRITDAQITASNYSVSFPPRYARLNNNISYTYWATDDNWIKVDFLDPVTITGIKTQGSTYPSWEDWVKELQIQYGLQNAEEAYILDGTQNKIFQANTDRDTVVHIQFPQEIRARYLRIVPTEKQGWISLRFEVIGCRDVLSTSTPEVTNEASTTEIKNLATTSAQTFDALATTQAPDELDQQLGILLNETVTTENVESVAATLTDLVATDTDLSYQDLDNINEVLTSIVNVSSPSVNVTRSVVALVDDIIDRYDDDYGSDGSVPEAPNQIQRALESQISTLQTQSGNTTIDEDNIAIRAVKVPVESLYHERLVFDRVGGDKGENSTQISIGGTPRPDAEVAISFQLPQNMLEVFSSNGSQLRISFIVYQNDKLFPSLDNAKVSNDADKFRREVGGRIISATVETEEVIRLPPEHHVELRFTINKEGDDKIENIMCVFWDNKASNGLGDWSTDGCSQYQNQTEPVICHCNHLTSFSVLVDRFKISSYALDIFSKVGCGVSIICLMLTLVTYLSRKEIRAKKQQQIFISFCSSLVSLYVIFIVGIERTHPQWGCVVVSILLHYFTLTTILWMAVEAFTMYVNIVNVVGVHVSRLTLNGSLLAWGVPAVVVAVIAIADFKQYQNTHHCFITIDYPFYFTQVLLLMLTILFNAYIFIRVMYKVTYGRMQSSSTRDASVASKMKKRALNASAVSSLLGLTWVFGLLSLIHEDATLTFQTLFCVFNSLQGLFVFILFCVLNDNIRAIWKVWCCKGSSDVPVHSASTGKNTRSSTVPNYTKGKNATSQM